MSWIGKLKKDLKVTLKSGKTKSKRSKMKSSDFYNGKKWYKIKLGDDR